MKEVFPYSIKIPDLLGLNNNCNVYCTDAKHHVLDMNKTQLNAFTDLLNSKSKEELVGKSLTELFPAEFYEPILEENNLVMQSGLTHKFLNIIKFKKNKSHIYLTIKTPMYDADNNIVGVFGISHHLSIHLVEDIVRDFLTRRECECLLHLLNGKTAKEIASELNLSTRSIESYIATIKTKMACNSKSALIDKAQKIGVSTLLLPLGTISKQFEPGNFTF